MSWKYKYLKTELQTEVKTTEVYIYSNITTFEMELNMPTTSIKKKSFACQYQNSISSRRQQKMHQGVQQSHN